MEGTQIQSLIWEDRICCGAAKPMCHNHWACGLEPRSCNYWSLCELCNRRSHLNELPMQHNYRVTPAWPQPEKSPPSNKDPGEGVDRGWDGWMASLTWWTWVWVDSGSWWWTGRPGVLRFMGSQRVGHDWATELNWAYFLVLLNKAYKPFTVYHEITIFLIFRFNLHRTKFYIKIWLPSSCFGTRPCRHCPRYQPS